jgi:hypothetical protein
LSAVSFILSLNRNIAPHPLFHNFMGASLKNKNRKSTQQLEDEKLECPARRGDCCHRETKNVF